MSETQADPRTRPLRTAAQQQALHTATRVQLASYESHKVVKAARIKEVYFGYDQRRDRNVTLLIPEDPRLEPIEVSKEYVGKHDPKAPGYFVMYPDNYESWSPVSAFEQGYDLVEEAQPQDLKALLADERSPDEDVAAAIDGERGG